MPVQRLAEAGDKFRQTGRGHGRILDEGHRLAVAGHAVEERHGSLAQVPERIAQLGIESGHERGHARHLAQALLQALDAIGNVAGIVAAKLHHEQGRGPSQHGRHVVFQGEVVPRQFQDQLIHHFDCRGAELQTGGDRIHGGAQRGKMRHQQAARLRQRQEPYFRLGNHSESSLAADQERNQAACRPRRTIRQLTV